MNKKIKKTKSIKRLFHERIIKNWIKSSKYLRWFIKSLKSWEFRIKIKMFLILIFI